MLLLCMTACQQHEESNLPTGNLIPILISDQSRIQTKVTGTAFDTADEIGLYVMKENNPLTGERHIDNMHFSLKEGIWTPDQDIFYPEGKVNCRFIAYYPYKDQAIAEASSTITCNVSPTQNESKNYSLSDFLVAEKTSVTASAEAVPLVFKHKLAELCIELVPGTAYDSAEELLAASPVIKIKGVATQVVYDIEEETYTNQDVVSDIIPTGSYSVSGGKVIGKHAVVVPQEIAGNHLLIEVSLEGKIYSFTFGTKHDIAPATKETYTLTIHKALTQGSILPSITDWENSSTVNGNLNQNGNEQDNDKPNPPVSSEASKITLPDFAGTSVYKVMKEDVQVAEVCREYLRATDIDNQAIVVYPVKDGTTDLTKGYVAQILDGNAGNALATSTHGGSVSWDSKNTLTYQKGTSYSTSIVYIDTDGNISSTTVATNPAELSLMPYYMHHPADGHDYPVTKIATQYWTAENLQTTSLTDGSSIKNVSKENDWYDICDAGKDEAYCTNDGNTFYSYYTITLATLPPDNWKIPEENQFLALKTYIDGQGVLLKSPVWSGSNLTGFSAIETGYRDKSGNYTESNANFWFYGKGSYVLSEDFKSDPMGSKAGFCVRLIRK